jgi:2-dehydro-3-deoxy-D-arabinonate dehydratase
MRSASLKLADGERRLGVVEGDDIRLLDVTRSDGYRSLADILHSEDPAGIAASLVDDSLPPFMLDAVTLLAPVDRQEIWAAGVTYKRSQVARMEESESGASHYDKVYTADRPELFFKSQPHRVSGPGDPVRVRFDSDWSVPEPEFTLVISPAGKIVGYTIGNDMSARDIEGENPLYLPQAKTYNGSCAMGPGIVLCAADAMAGLKVELQIIRAGQIMFSGETSTANMKRSFQELADYLFRETDFPQGTFLMTGTGIVPPESFTLAVSDLIRVTIDGATLENVVE